MAKKLFIFNLLLVFLIQLSFAGTKEDVYSKLKCCDCSEKFTACSCQHSKEMKAYIDALLESGLTADEIFVKTAKKFGLDVIDEPDLKNKIKESITAEIGVKRPQILIEPLEYNLGKVSKTSSQLELKASIENKGSENLIINDIKSSCVCTTVIFKKGKYKSPVFSTKGSESGWETILKPKQKAELIITTDLTHPYVKVGQLVRIVELKSNDPLQPLIKVKFQVEITE
ncbi:MAG: DUF1573 domain-containing protein [Candidatus Omnitrophica bacterium]|nr:DUF1573 domain-containing protein [Candidatus Omnitrophota bacterium]MBU2043645.1 DUF1573 domain-containing protein [Candidatus Omnitrophota bacterium]MBU2251343.1 DUF1573 domain-containing protein [Candidatus Omnitrophota bacterium]MBU2265975.1 DUF1573 domain-containing protein [Candidatus Omnitrophota bacterium]